MHYNLQFEGICQWCAILKKAVLYEINIFKRAVFSSFHIPFNDLVRFLAKHINIQQVQYKVVISIYSKYEHFKEVRYLLIINTL